MTIKKGDTVKIFTPANDQIGEIESTDIAVVKTVFKSGNIKVLSELGHGYTILPSFFTSGGKIEVVNV